MACLHAFIKGLPRYTFPDFSSEIMAFSFYCATGGLIGYIAKLIHQACLNANIDGKTEISLEDLAQAFEEAVWIDSIFDIPNPFKVEIDESKAVLMLQKARQIGTITDESDVPKSRGKHKLPSAGEVLIQ